MTAGGNDEKVRPSHGPETKLRSFWNGLLAQNGVYTKLIGEDASSIALPHSCESRQRIAEHRAALAGARRATLINASLK